MGMLLNDFSAALESDFYDDDEFYTITIKGKKFARRKIGGWVNATPFKFLLAPHRHSSLMKTMSMERVTYVLDKMSAPIYLQGTWLPLERARRLAKIYGLEEDLLYLLSFSWVTKVKYSGLDFYEFFHCTQDRKYYRVLRKCETANKDLINFDSIMDIHSVLNPNISKPHHDKLRENIWKGFCEKSYNVVVTHKRQNPIVGGRWVQVSQSLHTLKFLRLLNCLTPILNFEKTPNIVRNPRLRFSNFVQIVKITKHNFKLQPRVYQKNNANDYHGFPIDFKPKNPKLLSYVEKSSRVSISSLTCSIKVSGKEHTMSKVYTVYRRFSDGFVNASALIGAATFLKLESLYLDLGDPLNTSIQNEYMLYYRDILQRYKTRNVCFDGAKKVLNGEWCSIEEAKDILDKINLPTDDNVLAVFLNSDDTRFKLSETREETGNDYGDFEEINDSDSDLHQSEKPNDTPISEAAHKRRPDYTAECPAEKPEESVRKPKLSMADILKNDIHANIRADRYEKKANLARAEESFDNTEMSKSSAPVKQVKALKRTFSSTKEKTAPIIHSDLNFDYDDNDTAVKRLKPIKPTLSVTEPVHKNYKDSFKDSDNRTPDINFFEVPNNDLFEVDNSGHNLDEDVVLVDERQVLDGIPTDVAQFKNHDIKQSKDYRKHNDKSSLKEHSFDKHLPQEHLFDEKLNLRINPTRSTSNSEISDEGNVECHATISESTSRQGSPIDVQRIMEQAEKIKASAIRSFQSRKGCGAVKLIDPIPSVLSLTFDESTILGILKLLTESEKPVEKLVSVYISKLSMYCQHVLQEAKRFVSTDLKSVELDAALTDSSAKISKYLHKASKFEKMSFKLYRQCKLFDKVKELAVEFSFMEEYFQMLLNVWSVRINKHMEVKGLSLELIRGRRALKTGFTLPLNIAPNIAPAPSVRPTEKHTSDTRISNSDTRGNYSPTGRRNGYDSDRPSNDSFRQIYDLDRPAKDLNRVGDSITSIGAANRVSKQKINNRSTNHTPISSPIKRQPLSWNTSMHSSSQNLSYPAKEKTNRPLYGTSSNGLTSEGIEYPSTVLSFFQTEKSTTKTQLPKVQLSDISEKTYQSAKDVAAYKKKHPEAINLYYSDSELDTMNEQAAFSTKKCQELLLQNDLESPISTTDYYISQLRQFAPEVKSKLLLYSQLGKLDLTQKHIGAQFMAGFVDPILDLGGNEIPLAFKALSFLSGLKNS